MQPWQDVDVPYCKSKIKNIHRTHAMRFRQYKTLRHNSFRFVEKLTRKHIPYNYDLGSLVHQIFRMNRISRGNERATAMHD